MSKTYRIAQVLGDRNGWENGDGSWKRLGVESGDVPGAVMLAARRGTGLGKRADDVDYVVIADRDGIWGAGQVVAIGNDDGRRCFIVNPYDLPAEVRALVGLPKPSSARANVQYGILIDGSIVMGAW